MGLRSDEEFSGTERFAVRRRLGGGGMGVVYEVFDAERRTHVALKTLRKVSGAEIYRLKQEFRTLADVSHPNVVQLHELYAQGEQVFFTMELLDGLDFLAWVRNETGPVGAPAGAAAAAAAAMADTIGDPSQLARAASASASASAGAPPSLRSLAEGSGSISTAMPTLRLPSHSKARMTRLRDGLRQLAEGVQALHEAGIVHRDIKPSNVIVTRDGRVVLLDFGLASPTAELVGQSDSGVVGTPAYMSPEQGASGPLGPASDWYSIGVMLYEALTGRLPFIGRSLQVLMDKQQYEPPAPHELDPDAPGDLDALCVELLRLKPEARPLGREVLRRLGSGQIANEALASSRSLHSSSRTLVGREDEQRLLERAFADSREGRCVVAYVRGASGIGKSALVKRVLDDVEARGDAVVLTGRCYEMESVPFKAFDSLVDALSRHLARLGQTEVQSLLPRDVPLLARLFPVLLQVNAVADAPRRMAEPPDLQELRRRGFAALRELLQRLTDRRPLVLCIDDLQWGDADSAALLVELLRPPDPPPLLLVGIFRSGEAHSGAFARALAPAARESGVAVDVRDVTLEPLPHAQARELALRLFGAGVEPSEDVLARAESIARESAGSPFFVSELVRHVQAGAELGEPAGASVEGREASLGEFLRARLERLPPEARRLLEVVAVAGRPVQQALARQAAELAADGASGRDGAATVALLRAGHLVRTTGVRDLDTIETYHDRIRETMVAALPAAERVAHHRALAFAFEASGRADPETVAHHFLGAGMIDRAAQYTELAAAQAAEALAFQWAAGLYRQAIELRERLATEVEATKLTTGDRVRLTESLRSLRVALGDALANAGSGPAAALVYLEAAKDGQAADILEMRRRAAEQYLRSGHLQDGLAVLATVLGAVSARLAVTPRRALASLVWRRAQVRLRGLGYTERDSTQIAAEQLTRVDIFWSVSTALGMVDNIRAADFQSRHLLLALAAGEPYRIARALATEACYSSAEGARASERTQRLVARSREIAERSQHPHAIGMAIFAAGFSAVMEGRFHDGAALAREAEDTFRERCRNVAWETTVMQQMHLTALLYTGDLVELRRRVPSLLAQAEERGDRYATSALRTWVANLAWLLDDDVAGAQRAIDETSTAWPRGEGFILQHYWDLHARQHVALYDGRGEEAHARIVAQWPALRRSMLLRISALQVDALWQRARAAIAAAAAAPEVSKTRRALLSAAAADAASLVGQPFAPAFRDLLLGDVFALRGDVPRALARFEAARAELRRLRMSFFEVVALRRIGELRGDADAVAATDAWFSLRHIHSAAKMSRLICPASGAGSGVTLPPPSS